MLIIIVCLLMIDGARDRERERWQSQTQGERRDQWSSSSEKSGSYGLERALRSEEPVRKNKGGPWRMVGDGAIVVYRQLIINPGQNDPSGWHRDSRAIAATVRAPHLGQGGGAGTIITHLISSPTPQILKSGNLSPTSVTRPGYDGWWPFSFVYTFRFQFLFHQHSIK